MTRKLLITSFLSCYFWDFICFSIKAWKQNLSKRVKHVRHMESTCAHSSRNIQMKFDAACCGLVGAASVVNVGACLHI